MIVLPPNIFAPAAILTAAFSTAPSAAVIPLPGPIQALAASDAGIVVVSGGAVRVLDPFGRPLRTLWSEQPASERRPPRSDWSAGTSLVPGPTADSGWAVPYDPDDIDRQDDPRFVDDPVTSEQVRSGGRTNPIPEPDLARSLVVVTGGGHAWIGRSDGLWRVDLGNGAATRILRSRGDGIRAVAASPDGEMVATIDGGELLRSRDNGNTFEVIAPCPTSPHALATTRAGTVFMIDHDELRMVRHDHADVETLGLARATDVISCGEEAVVLANGALYTVSDPPVALAMKSISTVPTGADRIACHATGNPWIASGSGLWTSPDRGRSWVPRLDLPPLPILSVAVATLTIWVATPSGLLPLSASPPSPPSPPPPSTGNQDSPAPTSPQTPPAPRRLAFAAPSPPLWRWWHAALPRIDLSFSTRQTATRYELCGWVVATFALDRPMPASRRAGPAREIARRRIATEQTRAVLAVGPVGPTADSIAAEERRALARILEEHP